MFNHNTKTYIMKNSFLLIILALTMTFKTYAQDVKYIILKNNAANKVFFNEKDPNSLISFLKRQKQGCEMDLSKGILDSSPWLENGVYQFKKYRKEDETKTALKAELKNIEAFEVYVNNSFSNEWVYDEETEEYEDWGDDDDPFGNDYENYEEDDNGQILDTNSFKSKILSLISLEKERITNELKNIARPNRPNLSFTGASAIPENKILKYSKEIETINIEISPPYGFYDDNGDPYYFKTEEAYNKYKESGYSGTSSDVITSTYDEAWLDKGNPQEVELRDTLIGGGFDLNNISEMIIKMKDNQITRISFAKKLKGRKKLDIVFSVDYKSLMNPSAMQANFEHFENNKENKYLFNEKKIADLSKGVFKSSPLNKTIELCGGKNFEGVKSILSNELNNDSYAIKYGKTPDYIDKEMLDIRLNVSTPYGVTDDNGDPYYYRTEEAYQKYKYIGFPYVLINKDIITINYDEAWIDDSSQPQEVETRDTITEVYWNKEKWTNLTDCYLGKRYYKDENTGLYKAEVTDIVYAYKAKKGKKPIAVLSYNIKNKNEDIVSSLPELKADVFMYQKWVEILKTKNFPSKSILIDGDKHIKKLKDRYHFISKLYNIETMEFKEIDEPHF